MAERLRANSPLSELGVFVAHRAHAFATIACGVLFALLEPGETLALRDPAEFARAFGIELGSGIALGLLFGVVMHRKLDDRTRLTLVLGMVFLAGGFAFAMGVSEIFVASVAGWTFARTSRFSRDALQTMRSIGQPFVIALYFFAGLEWVTGSPWAWALVVPFVLLRQAGRRFGGFFGARMVGSGANLAASTFSPGGLSIAILLSFTLVFQDLPGVRDAYGPFLAALVLLETGSLRAARRWLLDVADVSFRRAKRGT
jgi:Kef-type K+ transport system membrane component KefB